MPKQKEKEVKPKLRQTSMGDFLSKSNKDSQDKKEGTPSRPKRRAAGAGMFSSLWSRGAHSDTQEYRDRYPGKKDIASLDDNYQFYMNQMPSKPDGDFIDLIHVNWWGNYSLLERHHGYIQWLFPIRDTGMNWHAQELQLHEIEKLVVNKKALKRVLNSYKMMLDFYGMELKDETDGTIVRGDNWRERFQHLNRSFHNYLRITRILKSLGELGYEHLKANFVKFILKEGVAEYTLNNVIESCLKFWIGVLRDDTEREAVLEYYDQLEEDNSDKKHRRRRSPSRSPSPSPERVKPKAKPKLKVQTYPPRESDDDDDPLDTLEYDMNLISDPDEEDDKDKYAKEKKEHEMSNSDEDNEEFKTPDVDESQEAKFWDNFDASKEEESINSNGTKNEKDVKKVYENSFDDIVDESEDKGNGGTTNEASPTTETKRTTRSQAKSSAPLDKEIGPKKGKKDQNHQNHDTGSDEIPDKMNTGSDKNQKGDNPDIVSMETTDNKDTNSDIDKGKTVGKDSSKAETNETVTNVEENINEMEVTDEKKDDKTSNENKDDVMETGE